MLTLWFLQQLFSSEKMMIFLSQALFRLSWEKKGSSLLPTKPSEKFHRPSKGLSFACETIEKSSVQDLLSWGRILRKNLCSPYFLCRRRKSKCTSLWIFYLLVFSFSLLECPSYKKFNNPDRSKRFWEFPSILKILWSS